MPEIVNSYNLMMTDKFQNKYRIPTARLKNWDYGSDAMYFVTICTAHRECYFGNIVNGEMVLSELGKIVEPEWIKTFEMRQDLNLQMGEYVVMPNHFHAIISIGINKYNTSVVGGAVGNGICGAIDGMVGRDAMHRVSTVETQTPKPIDGVYKNKFGPQSKNLASILRGFKSAVTTFARINNINFDWQPRFHDHIIRTDESFQQISKYISNNPANWKDDKFFQ
jgi:REP element-mobilizing transposase RayT